MGWGKERLHREEEVKAEALRSMGRSTFDMCVVRALVDAIGDTTNRTKRERKRERETIHIEDRVESFYTFFIMRVLHPIFTCDLTRTPSNFSFVQNLIFYTYRIKILTYFKYIYILLEFIKKI